MCDSFITDSVQKTGEASEYFHYELKSDVSQGNSNVDS